MRGFTLADWIVIKCIPWRKCRIVFVELSVVVVTMEPILHSDPLCCAGMSESGETALRTRNMSVQILSNNNWITWAL